MFSRACQVRRKYKTCLSQFHFRTFLQFASLHFSFSSGYPSMSVSFPQRYPFPAQPIPHWEDKLKPLRTRLVWSCKLKKINKKNCPLSYLTGDGAVPLQDTLSVDVTGVGQAVAAADLRLAALHLISCETGFTAAAVVGALCTNKDICFVFCFVFLHSNCKSTNMTRGMHVRRLNTVLLRQPHLGVVAQRVGGAASVVGSLAFVDVVADLD